MRRILAALAALALCTAASADLYVTPGGDSLYVYARARVTASDTLRDGYVSTVPAVDADSAEVAAVTVLPAGEAPQLVVQAGGVAHLVCHTEMHSRTVASSAGADSVAVAAVVNWVADGSLRAWVPDVTVAPVFTAGGTSPTTLRAQVVAAYEAWVAR